jgi:murein DD-endopeptidase MepM/ murein hydrolase activator NlpD
MKRRKTSEFGIATVALTLSILAASIFTSAFAGQSAAWPDPTYYTVVVRPGDTLTSVADRFHVAVTSVASMNQIGPRSHVNTGQVLRIPAKSGATREAVLEEALDRGAPKYASPPKSFDSADDVHDRQVVAVREVPKRLGMVAANDTSGPSLDFVWPIRGRVISSFGPASDGERNDGINIAAMLGAPIHAAASGTVTYAGDELKGYGNLILIAHADGYITAYAHAQSITVSRGDHVEKGEIIGTAGETGGVDRPQLHFEIRDGTRPLNPVRLLAALP